MSRRLLSLFAATLLAAASLSVVATGTAAARPAPVHVTKQARHFGPPDLRAAGSQPATISYNWSGYAATSKKPFTYVHSTFVQPALTCTGKKYEWTSNWVGLDGFSNGTVEQDGTFAHCAGRGQMTPRYVAWYEMYPAGSVAVFNVHAGDVIDASVNYSDGQFSLTVSDLSTGKTAGTSAGCDACQRTSAEWIVERPALCTDSTLSNCFLTRLADFGTTDMTGDQAQVTGGKVKNPSGFTNYPIDMIDVAPGGGFISLDGVSPLSGAAFTVTWQRLGNPLPITLG